VLERNLKLYGVAFAVDHSATSTWTAGAAARDHPDEVDRLLGAVLDYADSSFNTILQLGFATSIRKEYEWRLSRGESTRNLDAFKGGWSPIVCGYDLPPDLLRHGHSDWNARTSSPAGSTST
jgi:hypothetical protein